MQICRLIIASIAQAAERILGKDEVSSSNLDRSSKGSKPLMCLAFRYIKGFVFVRYEHIGTVTPVPFPLSFFFGLLLYQKIKGETVK